MFLQYCLLIFLLLRNSSQTLETVPLDESDQLRISEKMEYTYKTIDHSAEPENSTLPTVASAFWNPESWKESYVTVELMPDDESELPTRSKESDEMFEESTVAVKKIGYNSTMQVTTRAFWHTKKQKEARKNRKKIEREFLSQYDLASLHTDLTKLDQDKLKLVCQISSRKETYDTSKSPRFETKSLRFISSRKRKMTANLLYCPNMGAYVRESVTNPSQCVYIFKRRFFRTKLWLQNQKCVNLTTETSAPPNPE